MSAEHTSLAAEFFVLACLQRLGANAHITLGNHKAVDIIVEHDDGTLKTIDVKGSATVDWFASNIARNKRGHFLVFVAFVNRMKDLHFPPEVYIVPSVKVGKVIEKVGKQEVVRLKTLRNNSSLYRDTWRKLL
jgi:hypothetical protein